MSLVYYFLGHSVYIVQNALSLNVKESKNWSYIRTRLRINTKI